MRLSNSTLAFVCAALVVVPGTLHAQFTSPNVTTDPGAVVVSLGPTLFINHGLVGVGRISASTRDGFGETFGSVSGLQITDWRRNGDGTYAGTLNILPDRGYNAGAFFSDYAGRINTIGFQFKPSANAASLPAPTIAKKIALQNQIRFTTPITGVKFTYHDPMHGPGTLTTGLDPGASFTTSLFADQPVPYVDIYSGPATPTSDCAVTPTDCQARLVHKLALDAEALILKTDGSGYVGDEYGGYIYYFNSAKEIVGVIAPPLAFEPHFPTPGVPFFGAQSTPISGRRNNQGMEGVALSPDGTRLFALLQSGTVQDADGNQQNRRQTRLLVYDVGTNPTPTSPVAEYALTLPTYRANGAGGAASTVNRTAAQSEVVALDNTRLLVLSRDGAGLGLIDPNPTVYKSILLVDIGVGDPTDITTLSPSRDEEGGRITIAPGVLDPVITPLQWVEAINVLNATQLGAFHLEIDTSGLVPPAPALYQVSKLTLGEKWEGLSLVPALDPNRPNDYFLFMGNDNDFLTSAGVIQGPDGLVAYDGFDGYAPNRLPAPVKSPNYENDTLFLAYRVTILSGSDSPLLDVTAPSIVPHVVGTLDDTGSYQSAVTVSWDVSDPESGVVALAECGSRKLVHDTPGVTVTCAATNGAGISSAASVTVKINRAPPVAAAPASRSTIQK